MAGERKGEYSLYPYAKDLHYHQDQKVLSLTLQMYNETDTHEFSFGFKVHPELERFLNKTIGVNYEENDQSGYKDEEGNA